MEFTEELCRRYGIELRPEQALMMRQVNHWLDAPLADGKNVSYTRLNKSGEQETVETAVQHSVCALIEGGTGIGKTLAYLIPLLVHQYSYSGKQVLISTFTRALQWQILRGNDLTLAKRITGWKGEFAVRMGRANFVSASQVELYDKELAKEDDNGEWRLFVEWVHSWDAETTDPLDTTFLAWRENHGGRMPTVQDNELSESLFALDEDDPKEDQVFYQRHAEIAKAADLVLTNHASLLVNRLLPHVELFGDVDALVIDEADRLIGAAKSLLTRHFRPTMAIKRKGLKQPVKAPLIAKEINTLLLELGEQVQFEEISIHQIPQDKRDELFVLLQALYETGVFRRRDKEALEQIVKAFENEMPDHSFRIGYSPVRRLPGFWLEPVDVTHALQRIFAVWEGSSGFPRVLLTSATLGRLTSRKPMENVHFEYGIPGDAIVVRESIDPQKFGSMSFVMPDPRVGSPFLVQEEDELETLEYRDEWLSYVRKAIAYRNNGRKALVLVPSFRDVQQLSGTEEEKTQMIDGIVYHQPDLSGRHLDRYLSDTNCHTIITPSWWEGVNLHVGGSLWMQELLIARIPIPPFSEIHQEHMIYHLISSGRAKGKEQAKGILFLESADHALKKLRQGIGRGIRSSNDKIRVWILDPRILLDNDWLERMMDVMDDESFFSVRPGGHVAMQRWYNAIPTRFRSKLKEAQLFTKNGELL